MRFQRRETETCMHTFRPLRCFNFFQRARMKWNRKWNSFTCNKQPVLRDSQKGKSQSDVFNRQRKQIANSQLWPINMINWHKSDGHRSHKIAHWFIDTSIDIDQQSKHQQLLMNSMTTKCVPLVLEILEFLRGCEYRWRHFIVPRCYCFPSRFASYRWTGHSCTAKILSPFFTISHLNEPKVYQMKSR